jgi:hypothetical protein
MVYLPGLAAATTICLLATIALRAADTPTTKKDQHSVTVRGCLQGIVLTTRDETGTNTVVHQQFTLTGDRATLKQLKALSGHLMEVTGTFKGGTGDGGTRVAEKPIPKGRVYVGVGSTPVANPTQPQLNAPTASATIDVRTFADIDPHC